MKTSLGIWAFGPMATRFVPGGYQREHANETTVQRVQREVDGVAARIADAALREAQMRKGALRADELVYAAIGGE